MTPAFAGYVSGHSTFSRAAAEVHDGDHRRAPTSPAASRETTVAAGELLHEEGPTEDVTLQWATYFDAADQAGISRLYMGIHIDEPTTSRAAGSAPSAVRSVGARPALLRRHGAA